MPPIKVSNVLVSHGQLGTCVMHQKLELDYFIIKLKDLGSKYPIDQKQKAIDKETEYSMKESWN